jgi:hypothetical protein
MAVAKRAGRPNKRLHPTPLRGPKIGGILQSRFVPTRVPTYTAARVKRRALGPDATTQYLRVYRSRIITQAFQLGFG